MGATAAPNNVAAITTSRRLSSPIVVRVPSTMALSLRRFEEIRRRFGDTIRN